LFIKICKQLNSCPENEKYFQDTCISPKFGKIIISTTLKFASYLALGQMSSLCWAHRRYAATGLFTPIS
jgi:hypothetical protein